MARSNRPSAWCSPPETPLPADSSARRGRLRLAEAGLEALVRVPAAVGVLVAALTAVGFAGCGKNVGDIANSIKETATGVADKAKDAAKQVTQTTKDVTGTAAEVLEFAGFMELALAAPLKTKACYVKFLVSRTGRGNVLQLQSYRSPAQESFPSALLRAQVSATSLAELKGQTIPAQLFVQLEKDGPVWATAQEPVQLKITAIDAKSVTAELVGGTVLNAQTGAPQAVKGTCQGVLP